MLLVSGELPLGRRQNWPIYAAAERHGLPIGIHAGSSYRHPNTPVGWPSYYTEDYINQAGAFQTQLTSLIAEGVFAKFPDLTVVLMESGVTWLPGYLWRLTKFWKGLRSEVPWVSDPPVDHRPRPGAPDLAAVRRPARPGDRHALHGAHGLRRTAAVLHRLPALAVRGAPSAIPPGLDPALARKIMVDNPLRTYVRLRETRDMNVDVLNRSGVQTGRRNRSWRSPTATCIPRPPGAASAG